MFQQTCLGPLKLQRAAAWQASCGLLVVVVVAMPGLDRFCTLLAHKMTTHCPAETQPYTVLAGVHLLKPGVQQGGVISCYTIVTQVFKLSSMY